MKKFLFALKGTKSYKRNLKVFKVVTLTVIIGIIFGGLYFTSYSESVNKGLSDNLIRLHVLANSDSPEDQALKRDVRDAVIKFMKAETENLDDINQTKNMISENLVKIGDIAKEEIRRQGKDYSVKAMLGSFPFPTKSYGDITLPAGNYQALRVVIGNGEGANWWCVLFPPLCFVDATHGTVSDSVKEKLKKQLTKEEYSLIADADSEDEIPVKVKFKVVEFFQDSKIKFTGMFSKLFKKI